MRLDKLTVKAQEAIQAAQSLADQGSHQAVEPEHLLLALLQQQEGVVGPLLAKLGARPEALARQVQTEIEKLPAVRGGAGKQYASQRFEGVINRAWEEAERLKDEYVSTEHLLIAIAQEKGGAIGRLLAAAGPADLVVAIGGDGTLGEVLQGLPDPKTPVGLLPSGTANVLAHALKLPAAPLASATGTPSKLPLGSTGKPLSVVRYFPIASKFSSGKPSGSMYLWHAAQPSLVMCTSSFWRLVMGTFVG